jgi:hypothetical protein
MNKNKYNHNSNHNSVEDYMNIISNKCEQLIPHTKSIKKNNDEDCIIPCIHNYNDVYKYNYNNGQLKTFAKIYKLKISGNKMQLINRIFTFLYLSSFILKIQKCFRGRLQRKYNLLHGPAYMNRLLCNNKCDFVTLEPLEEINFHQFISYKDVDNFIYGFDITSLYHVIFKNNKDVKNPYNRINIPEYVLKNIKKLIKLSVILKTPINLEIEDETVNMSIEKTMEMNCLTLFQKIDSLGNYSDPQWFHSLNRNKLIKFVRELSDIWNYRAQLSIEVKRNISPPNGDAFREINMITINSEPNIVIVKKIILDFLNKFISNGIDTDSKSLAAYYILGALTLVNENAASSLPWLFQSVSYF